MIFVTGGTGLLGNCIVRELCQRDMRCRVLCRRETPKTALEGLPIEIIYGDLDDLAALDAAVQGCQAVVHSAAYIHIGWQNFQRSRQVNVAGTEHIIQACLRHGARMIHISTVDTLPAARSLEAPIDERGNDRDGPGKIPKVPCAYVISKSESEQAVRKAVHDDGLDAIIIHPGFMLAPYDWKPSSGRMFLEVARSPVLAAPRGGCSVCDARRVATAVVNSIERGECGESYILAGHNVTYQNLWTRMLQTAGRKRKVYRLGPGIQFFGKVIDLANRWLPIRERDVNGAMISMGCLNHFYDSTKAERDLSYNVGDLQQTLSDAWQWLSRR